MSVCTLLLAAAGVVLRFDDAHPVEQWRELVEAFDAEGLKASFAVPMGFVKSEEQRVFLREAAANGHEIMDHACHHGVFYDICRTAAEFEAARKLPCVAETGEKDRFVGFRFDFDRTYPGNRVFRGAITNGVLVVSPEEAKRLRRPNKVFVPSLDRFFGFFDAPDGRILLRSFYRPQELVRGIDVPEGELLLCDHRAFMVCEDALRYQAKLSRDAFRRCGLPDPKTWIQPGGWEPWVSVGLFRKVYAKEFGYTAADCIPGSGPWNGDPKAPDPEIARYTFRPTSYFDSASVTQESIRRRILEAGKSGRALCFLSHMQPSPKMKGGWSEWMTETRALLKWLRENKIPVRTMSGMTGRLYGSKSVAVLPAPREFTLTGGFAEDPVVTKTRDAALPAEGYWMSVGKDGVKITAVDERGGFCARMTLRQMEEDGRIPCAEGRIVSFYVCCSPLKPNTFIDFDPDDAMWLPLFAAAKGLSGFESWTFDSFPRTRWRTRPTPAGRPVTRSSSIRTAIRPGITSIFSMATRTGRSGGFWRRRAARPPRRSSGSASGMTPNRRWKRGTGISAGFLYAVADPYDRGKYWQDTYHHVEELREVLAGRVADCVLRWLKLGKSKGSNLE